MRIDNELIQHWLFAQSPIPCKLFPCNHSYICIKLPKTALHAINASYFLSFIALFLSSQILLHYQWKAEQVRCFHSVCLTLAGWKEAYGWWNHLEASRVSYRDWLINWFCCALMEKPWAIAHEDPLPFGVTSSWANVEGKKENGNCAEIELSPPLMRPQFLFHSRRRDGDGDVNDHSRPTRDHRLCHLQSSHA